MKVQTFFICSILLLTAQVFANYKSVDSEDDFYKYTNRSSLSVVQFYNYDKDSIKDKLKKLKKQIKKSDGQIKADLKKKKKSLQSEKHKSKEIKKIFKIFSNSKRYEKADVQFVSVNCSDKDSQHICQMFKINDTPSYVLFRNGIAIKDEGSVAMLSKPERPDKIQSFIKKYFDKDIDKIIEEKRKDEQARAALSAYYYDPFDYRWDYWYGPSWRGPYRRRRWRRGPYWSVTLGS